jgi:hypothetical protein
MKRLRPRTKQSHLFPLIVLLAAGPLSSGAAQGTAAIPAAPSTRRDPRGDTRLAVIPGFGDTLGFAPRLEGELLRGMIRQGGVTFEESSRRIVATA